MVVNLDPKLAAKVREQANRKGVAPEALALEVLREHFHADGPLEPRDEWERELLAAASDWGVSLTNEEISSEGLYE